MNAELLAVLDPEIVLRRLAETNGIRADQRAVNQQRALTITTNPFISKDATEGGVVVVGSSLVHLGDTHMCCAVTLQVGTPSPMSPEQGDVDFEVTLGPLCSPKYDQRGKPEDAYELEQLLETVLKRSSGMLDLRDLCIERERLAFQLGVRVLCLSAAGNLQDTAILAAVAALRDVRLPAIEIETEVGMENGPGQVRLSRDSTKSRPLNLQCCPIPATVGVFQQTLLLDPSHAELPGLHGLVRCVILDDGRLCHLSQGDFSAGGTGLEQAELQKAIGLCQTAAVAIRSKLLGAFPNR